MGLHTQNDIKTLKILHILVILTDPGLELKPNMLSNRFLIHLQWVIKVVMRQKILLDQLWAVVDGRPVQQSDILFVWLPDIISCFYQLLTALKNAKPDKITDRKTHQ